MFTPGEVHEVFVYEEESLSEVFVFSGKVLIANFPFMYKFGSSELSGDGNLK